MNTKNRLQLRTFKQSAIVRFSFFIVKKSALAFFCCLRMQMGFCSSSKAVHREKWKKAERDNRKCLCLKAGKNGWKY